MEEKILELFNEKKFGELKALLSEMNPADLAIVFEEIPSRDLPVVFRILPKELAAEVFVEMDTDMQQLLIEAFSDKELKEVMDELFMDDTVDIVDEMPATVAKRILRQTDPAKRRMINRLLAYPDDSAGSIMTTEYIDLKKDMTIEEALERIRKIGFDSETIYSAYVISKSRKLLGIVSIKDLLLNSKDSIIGDIMDENIIFANTLDDKEEVALQINKYDLLAIPVVDKENRLVGIVTVDDAIDVMEEEATEDIEKMAAILPSEHSYFKTNVFETFKARIPWLMLLMISATFTGAIISNFENKLATIPALIAFIPMLMDTGGNSGSQSSVTVIRAISLGDIEFRDLVRVIWKELRVSVICSAALAVVNAVKLFLVDYLVLNTFNNAKLSTVIVLIAVVCLTLFFTVIVAMLVGCTLPILAKKVGFDPAVMASPFITTIVDAISLMIYFGMATVLIVKI